jgi:hypothetical protein
MKVLKKAWARWKIIAHHIGVFQSRVILTLFYFILLLPIGLVFSLFKDALEIKKSYPTAWKIKDKQSATMEEMKEQF